MKQLFLKIILLVCFCLTASNAQILITNLDDVDISTSANLARDLRITERLCVASSPVSTYSLAAQGSGDNGEFVIRNGPFSINYELSYRGRLTGGSFRTLLPGTPLAGFLTRPLRNDNRCPGNAGRLRITIARADLNSAVAGIYRGFLQLTVIPE